MPKISAKGKELAVLRIRAGKSTMQEEADRAHVTRQAVNQWVIDYLKKNAPAGPAPKPAAPAIAPQPAGDHQAPAAEGQLSPQAKAAIAASGAKPDAPVDPVQKTQEALQAATAEDRAFVIDTVGGLKQTAGCAIAQRRFQLPALDPEVIKAVQLGPLARQVLETNASLIAPQLRKFMAGWGPIIVAMGIDSMNTMAALRMIAESRGWKPPARPPQEAELEEVPRAAAAQASPAPAPPIKPQDPPPMPVAVIPPGAAA